MRTVFIQANAKQLFGAKIAQFCIQRLLPEDSPITVRIINIDEMPIFKAFLGTPYMRNGKLVANSAQDLQSFTLSRFAPPELMGYTGQAVVIDPDIFAQHDITSLFELPMHEKAILACKKKNAWDTSVMLLDCAKLKHWSMTSLFSGLKNKTLDYTDLITLKHASSVGELSRQWNDLDHLDTSTRMLHTTNRLTQPWKTGLPIDFTRAQDHDYYLGIIPKPWVLRLLGRWPTKYQRHPNPAIETFFFQLVREALARRVITQDEVQKEITAGHIRTDLLVMLRQNA